MNWEQIRDKLSAILQTDFHIEAIPMDDWDEWSDALSERHKPPKAAEANGRLYLALEKSGGQVWTLSTDSRALTPAEKALIEMLVETVQTSLRKPQSHQPAILAESSERLSLLLRDWILQEDERRRGKSGEPPQEVPGHLVAGLGLDAFKIPLLLKGGYSDPQRKANYVELKKLLDTFFDEETVLVPLEDKEWLVLVDHGLLLAGGLEETDKEETVEEALKAFSSGLYEMLSNEWVGECHLTVSRPVVPAKELPETVALLRETMELGTAFRIEDNLHFPWELNLERLLAHVGNEEKKRFLREVFKGNPVALDSEMQTTLEYFIELGCNVSETAKKLYIHRNTLLYRLDKFKQETGLDVRSFHDAVLAKIALLLYKVTKSK